MRVTTADTEHSPLAQALYAPALLAWHRWWRQAVPFQSTNPVPWPQTVELAGPQAQAHRIRIEDIAQVRLVQ